jgi:hypothetical protein
MERFDLEEVGRYVKDCRRQIRELTEKLDGYRRALADRDAQIQKLQSALVAARGVRASNRQAGLRRYPR